MTDDDGQQSQQNGHRRRRDQAADLQIDAVPELSGGLTQEARSPTLYRTKSGTPSSGFEALSGSGRLTLAVPDTLVERSTNAGTSTEATTITAVTEAGGEHKTVDLNAHGPPPIARAKSAPAETSIAAASRQAPPVAMGLEASICGAAVASLVRETSIGDVYGLLFGTPGVDNNTFTTVVQGVVPCRYGPNLIARDGSMDLTVLQSLTAQMSLPLVGWFVHRRATTALPSIREGSAHRSLVDSGLIKGRPILFLLVTSNDNSGIISVEYTGFRSSWSDDRSMMPVPMTLLALPPVQTQRALIHSPFWAAHSPVTVRHSSSVGAAAGGAPHAPLLAGIEPSVDPIGATDAVEPMQDVIMHVDRLAHRVMPSQVQELETVCEATVAKTQLLIEKLRDLELQMLEAYERNTQLRLALQE